MALTLQDLINNGLLDELAKCFQSETDANILLTASSFPSGRRPNFARTDSPLDFWYKVCSLIESGIVEGGFEPLLRAASSRFPGNRRFAPFSSMPVVAGDNYSQVLGKLDKHYDVFLSFSSKDRDLVQRIARALETKGVHPWLDESSLSPGSPVVREIEQILSTVKVVAVFYGATGYGPWQEAEVDIAISRSVRGECLLIPVMLPGVSPTELPPFLRRLHGIKILDAISLDDEDAVDQLVNAIRAHS